MLKYIASVTKACGDTTKTLIEAITLPKNAKTLVGAWGYAVGGPGLTTLENVTGIIELESDDVNIQPCQIPIEQVGVLTSGSPAIQTKVWPMNAQGIGGATIRGYITMDMAMTVANLARFGLVVDV